MLVELFSSFLVGVPVILAVVLSNLQTGVGGDGRLGICWLFSAVVRSALRKTRKTYSGAMLAFFLDGVRKETLGGINIQEFQFVFLTGAHEMNITLPISCRFHYLKNLIADSSRQKFAVPNSLRRSPVEFKLVVIVCSYPRLLL